MLSRLQRDSEAGFLPISAGKASSQVSDVFQEKVVGITCYKHKFGVVGKRKHSRMRFSMFPTWEIGFGCHVTLVLKVIDFLQNYIITLYITVTNKVILVFFHQFNVELLQ